MYECPNCAGNLKFDISSQQLKCGHCSTQMDPYSFQKDTDAIEDDYFDTTIFTCPQCGGEIISEDTEAATFCSFCGGSTILDSRISRELKPKYIIPFKKTKDDCKQAYKKMLRGAFFAPNELKSEKHIDSFRGIYMPYWTYNIAQKGSVTLQGTKDHRSGDYILHDHYELTGDINAVYNGLSYDASSSFADNLSQAIAPFKVNEMKDFTPSFLSGFYADTSDTSASLYEIDAKTVAGRESYKKVSKEPAFRGYNIKNPGSDIAIAGRFNTTCDSVTGTMFPVWFLSYRNGDRVAYATVNGQTGKVAADLPIDRKKYAIGSLILAVPLFLLLNMLFTIRPTILLIITAILGILMLGLYSGGLKQIVRKEGHLDDKGVMSQNGIANPELEKEKNRNTNKLTAGITGIVLALIFMIYIFPHLYSLYPPILWGIVLVIGIIVCCYAYSSLKKLTVKKKLSGFISAALSVLIASIIGLLNPVSDLHYYVGAIASLVAIFLAISDLIHYYNILTTRKLPQFNRQGGDDRA